MSLRSLPGTKFPIEALSGRFVLTDYTDLGSPGMWTDGKVRVADLASNPPLSSRWEIIGWTARIFVGMSRTPDPGGTILPVWGKFGILLAGLAVNASLSNAEGSPVPLPSDMSTFTEVWNPNEDPGPVVNTNSFGTTTYPTKPIAATFIFPSPVVVPAGAQLQFALIMLPSLAGGYPGMSVGPHVESADFTLLYDD